MRFVADLPDGRVVHVDLGNRIRFPRPVSDADAQAVIAYTVAAACLPHLSPIPPHKRLERGPDGQLARVVEVPAASAERLAAEVGWQVARRLMSDAKADAR